MRCRFYNQGPKGHDFSRLVVQNDHGHLAFSMLEGGPTVELDSEQWLKLAEIADVAFGSPCPRKWDCGY